MTSGSPVHSSALQTMGEGKGRLLARGEKSIFFEIDVSIATCLTSLPFLRLPNLQALLILPFLKLLIGIVAHIAILHLCVPILANYYEKNLYLKSVAATTKRKMKEILSIPDIASHAGVFRGARISSLPTNVCSTEDNIPFPRLANHVVLSKFWKVDLDRRVTP